ncbi:hypothetical protein Gpo141_00009255 [Globisporangium polare]
MVTIRKFVLLAVDVACTVLTLMTGFQENPILVSLSGRYDLIRARFEQGNINYNIIRADLIDKEKLVNLADVGATYRFINAPTRTPVNLHEDRSTCMRVNSINSSILTIQYDDFFGKGARREQIFLHSISAPSCQVINFQPAWLSDCIDSTFAGNATGCYRYIFDNFDALLLDRQIQAGIQNDFGMIGRPFLKCLGRTVQPFQYLTDLVVHTSFWSGSSYHIEMQTSRCQATPVLRDDHWQWALFAAGAIDQSANVVFAVHQKSWIVYLVANLYGFVSLVMILRGIFVALSLDNLVRYIPSLARHKLFSLIRLPLVGLAVYVFPPRKKTDIVICRGTRFLASNLWMNHWLYISLSIAEAVLNIRVMYIVLGTGTWMLSKCQSFGIFLFVCTAITRLTWITCFVHTLLRCVVKMSLQMLRKSRCIAIRASLLSRVGWYMDACALFMSYKVYSILICAYLYSLLDERGTTTLMVRQKVGKVPVFGGFSNIANFWRNEIICDLIVTCSIVLVAGHVLSTFLLLTKYRAITHNRLLRLLQSRYVFVGWDVVVALEALGIEPYQADLIRDDVAVTNCSFASLVQQLYASGPSGFVEFAGDHIFTFYSRGAPLPSEPGVLRYPPEDARSMGLCKFRHTKRASIAPSLEGDFENQRSPSLTPQMAVDCFQLTPSAALLDRVHQIPSLQSHGTGSVKRRSTVTLNETSSFNSNPVPVCAFADRPLSVHAEWRWGRIVLVDFQHAPGQLVRTQDGLMMEFVVQDALTLLTPDEIEKFLGHGRLLHIS